MSGMSDIKDQTYCYIWEFVVKDGSNADFEKFYGADNRTALCEATNHSIPVYRNVGDDVWLWVMPIVLTLSAVSLTVM